MSAWVSVNGRVTPAEQGHVSVLDHGFLYGDSVYETLRTYHGRPFLLEPHLQRLAASGRGLHMQQDFKLADVEHHIRQVLDAARHDESLIRVLWTRGDGDLAYDVDEQQHSTVVVIAKLFTPPTAAAIEAGVSLAVVDVRRNGIQSLDPRLKTSNLLNPRMAYMEARRQGAMEALMLSPEGLVAEGSRNNIFLVEQGRVITPTVDTGILNGITRRLVLHLCRQEGIECDEARVSPTVLETCDEAFLTSTTLEVMPVTRLGARMVGDGRPGPVTRRLAQAYQRFVAADRWELPDAVESYR